MEDMQREVMSVVEAAEYLGISESIVRRLIRERKIPHNKVEGRILFYLPAIRNWMLMNVIEPDTVPVGEKEQESNHADEQLSTILKKLKGG